MPQLIAPRVWEQITLAASQAVTPVHIAVSYIGPTGDRLLPLAAGGVLVADVTIATVAAGSTSPVALERLRRAGLEIYSAENLHAKMFAFDDVGFVGSSNASTSSQNRLLEATVRVNSQDTLNDIREFVKSICYTRLSRQDLAHLAKFYRQPKRRDPKKRDPHQRNYSTLLMQLTNEQGGNRMSQVQPPKPVWEHFFGLAVGRERLPNLELIDESTEPNVSTKRQVVSHDHNYTIEIHGAEAPRPAILRVRRVGTNRYSYSVLRPHSQDYANAYSLLQNTFNPLRHSGRLWILL